MNEVSALDYAGPTEPQSGNIRHYSFYTDFVYLELPQQQIFLPLTVIAHAQLVQIQMMGTDFKCLWHFLLL